MKRQTNSKGFIQMWNEAIENDPYWQFEDLLEDNPEEASELWDNMRVSILVNNRLAKLNINHNKNT